MSNDVLDAMHGALDAIQASTDAARKLEATGREIDAKEARDWREQLVAKRKLANAKRGQVILNNARQMKSQPAMSTTVRRKDRKAAPKSNGVARRPVSERDHLTDDFNEPDDLPVGHVRHLSQRDENGRDGEQGREGGAAQEDCGDARPAPVSSVSSPGRQGAVLQDAGMHGASEQAKPAQGGSVPSPDTALQPGASAESASTEAALDSSMMDELAGRASGDGVFELIFPNGDTMGVAVSSQSTGTHFLLTPSSASLRELLQGRKKELVSQLEQRMQDSVSVVVL